ncbi:MAG: hypothetical protein PVI99_01890 [Anaerolineales bacterium]|jgi:hypothetical protein
MDAIFYFLNQPIVLTLITLIVGSYLLNLVAERRSLRDKLRDQAIEFLTDASSHVGLLVPHIYEQLRTRNLKTTARMAEELRNLFAKRMSIQVGSQAYLKSEHFYRQYFQLLNEFPGVIESMQTLEKGEDAEKIMRRAKKHISQLLETWPLEGESLHPQSG